MVNCLLLYQALDMLCCVTIISYTIVKLYSYRCEVVTTRNTLYRIVGKFGGGKVWQIWRIVRDSPN